MGVLSSVFVRRRGDLARPVSLRLSLPMTAKNPSIVKITRPSAAGILPRKRLFRLLDSGREYPIAWISGPPGSGKTALVASYLDARKLPCLWYQVDERDSDIATFFYYLGIGVKKASPERGKRLPLFTPEYALGMPVFARRYFEDLYSGLETPFILVLDNYQEAPVNSGFHEMIKYGLELIPEGINVFVLSRKEPPPEFSRLRANNEMSFLGWEEIRLTREETREMVRLKRGRGVTEEILLRLHKKTEGWAAGLMLVVLGSRIKKEDWDSIKEFPTKEVFDYFGMEIFQKINKETQEFFLKSAFLPTMTVRVAEKLTGIGTSEQILSDLGENHYFTEVRSQSPPVYQYHPLFREFLLSRARDSYSGDEISGLQRSAALLLEESGQDYDAVRLLGDAQDWDNLIRLILSRAHALMLQGRGKTLQEWIGLIPEEILESQPWLLYRLAVCKQQFSPGESIGHLFERVLRLFQSQENATGTILAWIGILEFYLWRDSKHLDYWIEWFYKHIHNHLPYPSPEIEARVALYTAISLSYRWFQHPDTRSWLERSISLSQEIGDDDLRMLICMGAGYYYQKIGDLAKINLVIREMEEIAKSPSISHSTLILSKVLRASLYRFMTGDQELHLKLVNEGLEMSQTSGIYTWDHILFSQRVAHCLDQGDLAGAGEFLRRMEPLIASRPRSAFFYRFTSAQYYALLGELRQAVEHARIGQKLIVEIGYPFYEALSRLQMAELLHQTGENQKASEQLKIVGELVNQTESLILEYMYWMAKAQFALDKGEEASGLESLRKAMELGREQGYVRTYSSWQPAVVVRLCAKALAEGIEVEYVQNLIRKLELLPDPLPVEIDNWPWPLKIYTLGQFELERDGEPIRFYGKVQHKPLAMLKALIVPGGKDQKEEQVSDLLWPEADGDAAHSSFKSNLFRLRQLLEVENAVKFQEGKAGLDPRYCWVDAWAFEKLFDKVEAGLKGKGETRRDGKYETGNRGNGERDKLKRQKGNGDTGKRRHGEEDIMQLAEKAIGLYKGHFLPGDEEETWTVSYRERLRNKFLRLIIKSGDYWQKNQQWEKAVEYYQKALEVDDLAEEFYQHLMICHQHLGQNAEAIQAYRRCRDTLSAVLGIEPSPLTQKIYKETTTKR